ncbi:MAG: ABC transporter permease [Anaerolineae bacterium]|nr:ABC transporter permease [Anaerolineales bacterium]MCQ3978410.1 ABC transporter permease [Anaerolineae bacterium]
MQASGRQSKSILPILLTPGVFWLTVFFVVPLLIVLVVSFSKRSLLGVVDYSFNLNNYARLFNPDSPYLFIFLRSLGLASVNTVLCLLFAYPFAFYIARQNPQRQKLLIFLVMVPFWTNFLIRTYALMFIIRDTGLINTWLVNLGIISQPIQILFTPTAIRLGMLYGYLPFAVLPLYASIEQLDFNYVQAAQDLGADGLRVFLRVILPLTMPGVVAASIITFIPALGDFITPDLMGGGNTFLIGNVLQQQFLTVRDWPFGSAMGIGLMVLVLGATMIYFRTGASRSA